MNAIAATTRVKGFRTKYVVKGGRTVARDMVDICQVGQGDRSVTPFYIAEFQRLRPVADPENDQAAVQMHALWAVIRPQYEAWKKGHELPDNGTPLAAWPGLTPEQAEILRGNGYRSVEELAAANDSAVNRIQLPGARTLVEQAQMFLKAADKAKVADDMARMQNENAALKSDLEEMRQILLDLQTQQQERPRRGRPPKSDDDQVAA